MKNEHKTMSNLITFVSSLTLLIIDSPFLFFIERYGLNSKLLPLFIATLMLYNQIILPFIISKILEKFSGKLTLEEIHLVEKELRKQMENEAKNNECLFINENGERTYRTGDYGFSKDGVFYVLGRKDEQIKFNGYRIELSEIEEKVLNLKALSFKNTAVVALKRNTGVVSRLICFYTANEKKADEEIKTYLSAVLPSYMIPSEFIHIENIPVTTNHKVDKKTLLEQYQNGNFK